jgi:hypothetical protein
MMSIAVPIAQKPSAADLLRRPPRTGEFSIEGNRPWLLKKSIFLKKEKLEG